MATMRSGHNVRMVNTMHRNQFTVDVDALSSMYQAIDDETEEFATIEDWQDLVEEIAELEELIEEARLLGTQEALASVRELEGLVARKRENLKLFNVG
jgi:urease accessory protein UreF